MSLNCVHGLKDIISMGIEVSLKGRIGISCEQKLDGSDVASIDQFKDISKILHKEISLGHERF